MAEITTATTTNTTNSCRQAWVVSPSMQCVFCEYPVSDTHKNTQLLFTIYSISFGLYIHLTGYAIVVLFIVVYCVLIFSFAWQMKPTYRGS